MDEILAQLPNDFFKSQDAADNESPPATDKVAFQLALLGWQGLTNPRMGPVPNSASCQTCLRRLGLWMFKSKEVDENGEVLVPAPMDYLDPVREHRFFCPWKNPETQMRSGARDAGEEPQPGWKILLKTLENDADLRSMYEGRPRSNRKPMHGPVPPSTPSRATQDAGAAPSTPTPGGVADLQSTPGATDVNVDDDEAERAAKDEERWARLKKVKSLFNMKGARRLGKSSSRPGTSHSTRTQSDAPA